jgi:hypothetical protein
LSVAVVPVVTSEWHIVHEEEGPVYQLYVAVVSFLLWQSVFWQL